MGPESTMACSSQGLQDLMPNFSGGERSNSKAGQQKITICKFYFRLFVCWFLQNPESLTPV